jgi:hypothetical protein
MPRDLRDHNGAAPHQSIAGREALLRHPDIDLLSLFNVFDRAFDFAIHARWESAKSLIDALKKIKIGAANMVADDSPEEMVKKLRTKLEGHEQQRLQRVRVWLERTRAVINKARDTVVHELPGLVWASGNNYVNPSDGKAGGMTGIVNASDNRGYTPQYLIEVQGAEIVVSLEGAAFFRCTGDGLEAAASQIRDKARGLFLRGLGSHIQD